MSSRTRRVLIVSPRFPPINAPEHHRVRTSLPYYERFGWAPTVVCVSPATVGDSVVDPHLGASLPVGLEVVRVPAWDEATCRRAGFGQLDYRCLWPLYRAGTKLLKRDKHEVVFFSTTVFLAFLLGPIWKRRFGCRVVYDFQDPWFHGDVPLYTRKTWPGVWWKFLAGQRVARYGESACLSAADHVISVSEGYVSTLQARYPSVLKERFTVATFGASPDDFEFVATENIQHDIFVPDPQRIRWVYAGRVGPDMFSILDVLFAQLVKLKTTHPDFARRLDVHFVGTNYAPKSRTFKVLEPIARRHGVEGMVTEHSERIPYFQTLSLYAQSEAILLLGADSPDYTASKLFNCVLARKPVLALLHGGSAMSRIARRFPNVHTSVFRSSPEEPAFARAVAEGLDWLKDGRFDGSRIDDLVAPWSAEAGTRVQCAVFDAVTST